MKLRRSTCLGLLAVLALWADFDPAQWQRRREIAMQGPVTVARLRLDAQVYRDSNSELADLRVLRDAVETPFTIKTLRGGREMREVAASVINQAVTGRGLELQMDAGSGPARHNHVRVETAKKNFKQRVQVSTSDDGKHWALVRGDASIFDDSESDRPSSSLVIDYPVSTRRFVRVEIVGWTDVKAVSGAWINLEEDRAAVREEMLSAPNPAASMDQGRSVYVLDFGFHAPHDRVSFEVAPGLFSRRVDVNVSDDKKQWMAAGSGMISRTAERGQLSVEYSERWSRYVQMVVNNLDDRPLAVSRISVESIAREIAFPAKEAGRYWLYEGNATARFPSYDLTAWLPSAGGGPGVRWGATGPNPAYRAPVPAFSERNQTWLYVALGVAMAVMSYVAIHMLRQVRGAS